MVNIGLASMNDPMFPNPFGIHVWVKYNLKTLEIYGLKPWSLIRSVGRRPFDHLLEGVSPWYIVNPTHVYCCGVID